MLVVINVNGRPCILGHAAPPPNSLHTEYRFYKASQELPVFHPKHPERLIKAMVTQPVELQYADVHIRMITGEDGIATMVWVVTKPEDVVYLPKFRALP